MLKDMTRRSLGLVVAGRVVAATVSRANKLVNATAPRNKTAVPCIAAYPLDTPTERRIIPGVERNTTRPGGGIGRRTALRWQRVTSCRFKSCPGHFRGGG